MGGELTINGGVWYKDFNLTNTYQYTFNLSEQYINYTNIAINQTEPPLDRSFLTFEMPLGRMIRNFMFYKSIRTFNAKIDTVEREDSSILNMLMPGMNFKKDSNDYMT